MTKSRIAVGLLAAVVIVVGVAASRTSLNSNMGAVAESISDSNGSVVVKYTDGGFEPSAVQIPRGSSVTFLNVSDRALRIAPITDPKDATSAYLGFEAQKSIGRNEAFGVSTTLPGIWGYKNLNRPSDIGVVVVE